MRTVSTKEAANPSKTGLLFSYGLIMVRWPKFPERIEADDCQVQPLFARVAQPAPVQSELYSTTDKSGSLQSHHAYRVAFQSLELPCQQRSIWRRRLQ